MCWKREWAKAINNMDHAITHIEYAQKKLEARLERNEKHLNNKKNNPKFNYPPIIEPIEARIRKNTDGIENCKETILELKKRQALLFCMINSIGIEQRENAQMVRRALGSYIGVDCKNTDCEECPLFFPSDCPERWTRLENEQVKKMKKKDMPTTTIEVLFVPIDAVEPNPYNPNVLEEDKDQELRRLMKATDARAFFAKDPLRASPYDVFYGKTLDPKEKHEGRYVFIDGEHRWLDAKALGWTEVGIAVESMTIAKARQETYARNYLRGTTDPVKEAKLFKDEVDDGLNIQQIADKYFKDPGYISRTLALLELSEKVIAFLKPTEGTDFMGNPRLYRALTKSHLEHLVGLPEVDAITLAQYASRNDWTAKELEREADKKKEAVEFANRKEEAMKHFVMTNCPICDAPGQIEDSLKTMRCGKSYTHYELGLRKSLTWGPLDTKEAMLKRKFKLDDGRTMPLTDIIKLSKKKKAVTRKLDWFKHEKTVEQLMPKIHAFAYDMILANRKDVQIDKIQMTGKMPDGKFFNVNTDDNGLWIQIGGKELAMFFESKEWKRGNFKTRVNVRGVEDEAGLKKVQIFLDKLMVGDARVEDYPFEARFEARKERITQMPSLEDEPDEEGEEEAEDE